MEQVAIFVILVATGFFVGRYAENRHYHSIQTREEKTLSLPVTSFKKYYGNAQDIRDTQLVAGSVVISVDYFKQTMMALRNLFGGDVQAYETLLDRARREAILRMKESCPNADQIINLRLETTSIYKGSQHQIGSIEVIAYGTAVYL